MRIKMLIGHSPEERKILRGISSEETKSDFVRRTREGKLGLRLPALARSISCVYQMPREIQATKDPQTTNPSTIGSTNQ